jgi:hypothetical protein
LGGLKLVAGSANAVHPPLTLGLMLVPFPPPPERLRFTIEARKEAVRKLAANGMSQRDIAKATGGEATAGDPGFC